MKLKKGTVVLVVVALLLAATAITVNAVGEKDVSTESDFTINAGSSEIGITVLPNDNAEDRLLEENLG